MRLPFRLLVVSASLVILPASSPTRVSYSPGRASEVSVPSPAGAGEPYISPSGDGGLLMTWLQPGKQKGSHALMISKLNKGKWSAPSRIAEGTDLVVNRSDFPSVVESGAGHLVAHWPVRNGQRGTSFRLAQSTDGGKTWGAVTTRRDEPDTENGFVSLMPIEDGRRTGVIWLDGRNTGGEGEGEMALRYAALDRKGLLQEEREIDARVCDCCQTAIASTRQGLVVAYRDRSRDEIRDIAVARQTGGKWSGPALARSDRWKLNGCPVNGPQVDARGDAVVIAWYTGSGNVPRVHAAFSSDGGATFAPPVRVDGGSPRGRVDVVLLSEDSALVTWVEQSGRAAQVETRQVWRDRPAGKSVQVTGTSATGAAGVPRMALASGTVYIAWAEAESSPRIRLAALPLVRTSK